MVEADLIASIVKWEKMSEETVDCSSGFYTIVARNPEEHLCCRENRHGKDECRGTLSARWMPKVSGED